MKDSPETHFCSAASIRSRRWVAAAAAAVDAPSTVPAAAARIAAGRGIRDLDAYFTPSFRTSMPDPSALAGMDVAAARFIKALETGERIGIVGDYDVDGATSTTIVVRFLRMLGHANYGWRIPHRIGDGYGPNPGIVQALRDDGATLLVILDSGTTSFEAIGHARDVGMEVIVLDHHEPAPRGLPDALLVNPKQDPSDRSLDYLCTAGLAFLFAVAVTRDLRDAGRIGTAGFRQPDLKTLLGLVALGTVADVVPLVGVNRAFVALGLARMADIPGVRALSAATQQDKYDPHTCGFVFGPCLNAAGRLEDMGQGVELLLTEDFDRAKELAERLFALNGERRKLTLESIEQAKAMVDDSPQAAAGVIVVHDEAWHPGIVGLVAAKIREAYDRPTIAIGNSGKGSCRSVPGFDIGAAVIEAHRLGLLVKGGGHAAAAGLTADPARAAEFKSFLDARYASFVAPPTKIDLVLKCGETTPALAKSFEPLAPFGMGNERPRVAVVGGVGRRTMVIKQVHVKLWLSGPCGETEVMAFNATGTPLGDALLSSVGRRVDVLGTLAVDSYGGVEKASLRPEDAMLANDKAAAA